MLLKQPMAYAALRLSQELKAEAKAQAKREGIPLGRLLRKALEVYLAEGTRRPIWSGHAVGSAPKEPSA